MEKSQEKKRVESKLGLTQIYLLAYNFISAIGWLFILLGTHKAVLQYKNENDLLKSKDLYKNVSFLLKLFQTLSLLEVLHAAIKIVRSNPLLNFLQIFSRLLIVWGIMNVFPPSSQCIGVLMVCFAWSVTEVIRYSYYAFNIFNVVPGILTWCRYSFFIVLYPLGVAGELTCIFYAIAYVYPMNIRKQYSYLLPNKFNVSFDIFFILCACVIAYIPGFPTLYKHMLSQRRKVLSSGDKEKSKKNE